MKLKCIQVSLQDLGPMWLPLCCVVVALPCEINHVELFVSEINLLFSKLLLCC